MKVQSLKEKVKFSWILAVAGHPLAYHRPSKFLIQLSWHERGRIAKEFLRRFAHSLVTGKL